MSNTKSVLDSSVLVPVVQQPPDDEGSVWSFVAALLRHRYLVAGSALLCGAAVAAFLLLSPRSYTASTSFLPQDPSGTQGAGGIGQLAAQFGIPTGRASAGTPQFYANLLQSREILRDVVLTEYSTPEFTGNLLEYYDLADGGDRYALQRGLREFRDDLRVTADRTTGIVHFEVDTKVPALSAQVARRMLALVHDYNLRRLQTQARAEREFTEQRLNAARDDLARAEQALVAFYQGNRRFEGSPELVAREARLQRQVNLRQEVFLTLNQNYEAAKIEEVRSTPLLTVVERPEGFVEPRRRGTVAKTLAAVVFGGVLGVILAFVLEYLRQARRGPSEEFVEVAHLWNQAVADLRGGFLRRRR